MSLAIPDPIPEPIPHPTADSSPVAPNPGAHDVPAPQRERATRGTADVVVRLGDREAHGLRRRRRWIVASLALPLLATIGALGAHGRAQWRETGRGRADAAHVARLVTAQIDLHRLALAQQRPAGDDAALRIEVERHHRRLAGSLAALEASLAGTSAAAAGTLATADPLPRGPRDGPIGGRAAGSDALERQAQRLMLLAQQRHAASPLPTDDRPGRRLRAALVPLRLAPLAAAAAALAHDAARAASSAPGGAERARLQRQARGLRESVEATSRWVETMARLGTTPVPAWASTRAAGEALAARVDIVVATAALAEASATGPATGPTVASATSPASLSADAPASAPAPAGVPSASASTPTPTPTGLAAPVSPGPEGVATAAATAAAGAPTAPTAPARHGEARWLAEADALLARLAETTTQLDHAVDASLAERQRDTAAALLAGAVIVVAGLASAALLAGARASASRRRRQALHEALARLGDGDFAPPPPGPGGDEFADLGRRVDHAGERLSARVVELRSAAGRIGEAGAVLADDLRRLVDAHGQRTRSLGASIADLGTLVRAARAQAESAAALAEAATGLGARLDDGRCRTAESAAAVDGLRIHAARAADAGAALDDLAAEIRLLALNASVEAARAGMAGHGFAAIAADARRFAQRCGDAGTEIRAIADGVTVSVDDAARRLARAGAAIDVADGAGADVARRLATLSAAGPSQCERAGGLDAVLRDLDARDGALGPDLAHASRAAGTLAERTQQLHAALASMRLRHAGADEAQALVRRALAHWSAVGCDRALDDLHAGGWADRDLGLFVLDRDGRCVAFAAQPAWRGRRLSELPGGPSDDADAWLRDAWAALDASPRAAAGVWVERAVSDGAGAAANVRAAYVARLDDGLLLGCELRRDPALAAPRVATA